MNIRKCVVVLLLLAGTAPACRRAEDQAAVTIATTPDAAAIGIVGVLADRFTAESKVPVNVIVTEAHLLAGLMREGAVEVVFTVSPDLQTELQRAQLVRLAQTVGYNDYLLMGPKRDPARAGSAKNASEALRRIARRDRAFCSPVDLPELRHREAILWDASPAAPKDDRRYRVCHGTALEVLEEASRRQAYTLTDRSTLARAGSSIKLVPLLQGTPMLRNDLTVLLARTERPHRNAEWFVQWVMSYRGRDTIDRHRYDGERRLFLRER